MPSEQAGVAVRACGPLFPAAAAHLEYLIASSWWRDAADGISLDDGRTRVDLARAALGDSIAAAASTTALLEREYRRLRVALRKDVAPLRQRGRPVPIAIPPITAIVLDLAKSPEHVIDAALDLRNTLTPHRRAFTEYEQRIRDDSLPLRESLTALDDLDRAMSELVKPFDSRDVTKIAEWKDLADLAKGGLDGLDKGDVPTLGKVLAGKPLSEAAKWFRRRRVLYLADLRTRFLNIRNYGNLAHKALGMSFSPADVAAAKSALNETAKLQSPL